MQRGSAAIQQMEATVRAWERRSDRRATFLNCYLRMTRNILAALRAGEFHDAAWVHRLLERFAEYYFEALDKYRGEPTEAPSVWLKVHNVTLQRQNQVLQDLLLGVNAHINYDLVLALVDVLEPEWQGKGEGWLAERYSDHCRVNTIIAHTIDEVQDEVIEVLDPKMDLFDKLMGRIDEWMISSLITHWRDEVWTHAIQLLNLESVHEREQKRRQVERLTQDRAEAILLEGSARDLKGLL